MMKNAKLLKALIFTVIILALLLGLSSMTFGKMLAGGTDLCQDLCPNDPDSCEVQCNDNTGDCILICYYEL